MENEAPGREALTTLSNTSGVHISGFSAGENPSRNHASMPPRTSVSASITSPMTNVRRTLPPSKHHRFHPGTRRCHLVQSSSAYGRRAGQSAKASASSLSLSGYFSVLKKSRLLLDGEVSLNSRHAHKKFNPVPKPTSPMAKLSPHRNAEKRSGRLLPRKKTWHFSSRPESSEK